MNTTTDLKPHYIANRDARKYVQKRTPFNGSPNPDHVFANELNPRRSALYAGWISTPDGQEMYVVCSYGDHWPLFIYCRDVDMWFENSDKYGNTTSRHHSTAHPHCETTLLDCSNMVKLMLHGYTGLIKNKLINGAHAA